MTMNERRYRIWAWEKDDSEPVPPRSDIDPGPHKLFGLRRIIRKLIALGYRNPRADQRIFVMHNDAVE